MKKERTNCDTCAFYAYDEDYEADYQPSAYKSRRIENAKRNQFQHKLNRILFWVVVLLILLFIAVFYFQPGVETLARKKQLIDLKVVDNELSDRTVKITVALRIFPPNADDSYFLTTG